MKYKCRIFKRGKNQSGITLVALVVTVVVLLLLAGVSIRLVLDNNGIIAKANEAKSMTIESDEREKVEMAYGSAAVKRLGENVLAVDLLEELDKTVGEGKAVVTTNGDGTLNVLFSKTEHNFNVNKGEVQKVEVDNTKMAVFDTGENVAKKMYALAPDGVSQFWYIIENFSINAVKRYNGTPDLTKMTEANIVSWTEEYEAYEQNPDAYKDFISEGTELCPIYMWFEEDGTEEVRNWKGDGGLTEVTNSQSEKKVKPGTIYWWCESNNVYLNPDSSKMFLGLNYISDISGLQSIRADYVTNMEYMFSVMSRNKRLKNFDALSGWNTCNVTNLAYTFTGYENLDNITALRKWNTSNVINFEATFGGDWDIAGSKIKDITPLENWDVSSATNMSYLFFGQEIENLKALENWNVNSVTDMSYMFYGLEIENLKALENWDVSNVTNMSYTFAYCSKITDVYDIRNWNVSSVTDMSYMFESCSKITDASDINDWNISSNGNFGWMFCDCQTHPDFTKVKGTWDENGTFTPNN